MRAVRRIMRAAAEVFAGDARRTIEARADSSRADGIRAPGAVAAKAGAAAGKAFDTMVSAALKATRRGLSAFEVAPVGADKKLAAAAKKRRRENVELVTRATEETRDKIAAVLDELGPGVRWEEAASRIAERVDVAESRAELIARDQSLKATGEINEIVQTSAGIEEYEWSTSGDNRVRDEHEEREGRVFSWDDPPEDGHPGEAINCRCVAIPILP